MSLCPSNVKQFTLPLSKRTPAKIFFLFYLFASISYLFICRTAAGCFDMGSLFLSRSDSSDYVSEAAICSDDGSASTFNTSYNVPINVRNNFANTQIMTPLCCYVINTMTTTDEKLDRSDRTKMIETTFKKFVDDLEYDYLYSSIVDYMVWTRSVEKFCRRRGIDKSDITMTSK